MSVSRSRCQQVPTVTFVIALVLPYEGPRLAEESWILTIWGDIRVMLHHRGSDPLCYKAGQAIAQLIILPCSSVMPTPVEQLDDTSRGIGGFGSTDAVAPAVEPWGARSIHLAETQKRYGRTAPHTQSEYVDRNDPQQLHAPIDTRHDVMSTVTYYTDHRHRVLAAKQEKQATRHRTLCSARDD